MSLSVDSASWQVDLETEMFSCTCDLWNWWLKRNVFLCLLTGGTGDSAEITSHALTVQPLTTSKSMGHELSAETFDPNLDMNMFGDLGAGFIDPLGDASMDSFTDLTALLAGVSCCLTIWPYLAL